jgi:hypothetical protein
VKAAWLALGHGQTAGQQRSIVTAAVVRPCTTRYISAVTTSTHGTDCPLMCAQRGPTTKRLKRRYSQANERPAPTEMCSRLGQIPLEPFREVPFHDYRNILGNQTKRQLYRVAGFYFCPAQIFRTQHNPPKTESVWSSGGPCPPVPVMGRQFRSHSNGRTEKCFSTFLPEDGNKYSIRKRGVLLRMRRQTQSRSPGAP